jgi:uncharacterized protein
MPTEVSAVHMSLTTGPQEEYIFICFGGQGFLLRMNYSRRTQSNKCKREVGARSPHMLRKLLPRETGFFEYFDQLSIHIIEACDILRALASGSMNLEPAVCRIRDVEHAADRVTHECIDALHRTFITPFDRGDIHNLVQHLDDIIDLIEAAIVRMEIYNIDQIRPETLELADLLASAALTIQKMLTSLRRLGKSCGIPALCAELHSIEGLADVVHRTALAKLFHENESRAIYVFKWKEILGYLERATDQCEHVANIVEGVMIEAS